MIYFFLYVYIQSLWLQFFVGTYNNSVTAKNVKTRVFGLHEWMYFDGLTIDEKDAAYSVIRAIGNRFAAITNIIATLNGKTTVKHKTEKFGDY